jgi:hypothetical protein
MRTSLNQAIDTIIAHAVRTDELIRIAQVSGRLARDHPDCGLPADVIAEMLLQAGIHARVPLEIGVAKSEQRAVLRLVASR